ncbi:MAG: hypothetical protein R3C53_06490 [Pirellulaceae bacterium]
MTLTRISLATLTGAVTVVFSLSSNAMAQCNCGGSAAPMAGGYYDSFGAGIPMDMGMQIPIEGIPMAPPLPEGGQIIEGDSIYLTVNVPEKAILTVNGDPTISTGPTRYFVVKGLDVEREYKFVIVAETANAAGVAMEQTETVKLKPGSSQVVTLKPVRRKGSKPPEDAVDKADEAIDEAADAVEKADDAIEDVKDGAAEKSEQTAEKVTSRRLPKPTLGL